MKKHILIALAAACGLGLFAGCGKTTCKKHETHCLNKEVHCAVCHKSSGACVCMCKPCGVLKSTCGCD